jgi:hypothetical protein
MAYFACQRQPNTPLGNYRMHREHLKAGITLAAGLLV